MRESEQENDEEEEEEESLTQLRENFIAERDQKVNLAESSCSYYII